MSDPSGINAGSTNAPHPVLRSNGAMRKEQGAGSHGYTRFVVWMKVVLPLAALSLLALVLFYSGIFDDRDQLAITFAEINSVDDDLRMVSPRVSGLDAKGRPYEITADTATQTPGDPNHIRLENIAGHLTLNQGEDGQSGDQIFLTAVSGLLQPNMEKLTLNERIDIRSQGGYVFYGTSAEINLADGTISTAEPVHGDGPFGVLDADSMVTKEGGNLIRFMGNVKLVIQPGGLKRE